MMIIGMRWRMRGDVVEAYMVWIVGMWCLKFNIRSILELLMYTLLLRCGRHKFVSTTTVYKGLATILTFVGSFNVVCCWSWVV